MTEESVLDPIQQEAAIKHAKQLYYLACLETRFDQVLGLLKAFLEHAGVDKDEQISAFIREVEAEIKELRDEQRQG